MPERMLSEHSEPGYFIELADSLESTLRHMTWERAQALSREVLDFFAEVAPESLPALSGFHLETPGQAGCFPPCLSTLEPVEEGPVKEAVERINREKGLRLRLSWTSLLEGKPASREDYVGDIRDALRLPEFDISLPKQILEHRQRLMDGAFARFKSWEEFDNSQIGQRWVKPARRGGKRPWRNWIRTSGRWGVTSSTRPFPKPWPGRNSPDGASCL